mgnify:CR=1 FL=1
MSNILFCYKNFCENASTITETWGTSNGDMGTSKLCDNNLQSYWETKGISPGPGTVANVIFGMGSQVYVDSLIVIHNLNETGTLYIMAGNTTPPTTTSYGLPILGSTGTSINFFSPEVAYSFWQIFADGTKLSESVKIKEVFIGKRDTLSVNPQYPFRKEIEAYTILTESEKGQRKVYHKYTKQRWGFEYPAIDEATFGTLNKIRNFCGGSYRPFWMCLDFDDDKFATYMVRFMKNSYKHQEIIDGIHDISFSVEEEL